MKIMYGIPPLEGTADQKAAILHASQELNKQYSLEFLNNLSGITRSIIEDAELMDAAHITNSEMNELLSAINYARQNVEEESVIDVTVETYLDNDQWKISTEMSTSRNADENIYPISFTEVLKDIATRLAKIPSYDATFQNAIRALSAILGLLALATVPMHNEVKKQKVRQSKEERLADRRRQRMSMDENGSGHNPSIENFQSPQKPIRTSSNKTD